MILMRRAKWIYAAAGTGIAIGVYNYLQSDKKCVQASWTVNHQPSVKWDYNWDRRNVSSVVESEKNKDDPKEQNRVNNEKLNLQPIRHLILIRHGQYEEDAKDDAGRKLTEKGRKQADYVAKYLKELGYNYTKITHSTMTRAMETSDIIQKYFPDVPTESDDLLREGSPIPPEPPCGSFRPEYQFFTDGARIEGAFRKYFHRADPDQKEQSFEIIVCHANVIRYFLCRALQFPPEGWLRFGLHHCSITWISIFQNGEVYVCNVGNSGYLPKDVKSA